MSSHQEPEQGILWEQIEEALDVIKGLTGSTRALEDWLNGYTDTFEPVWDALYIRIQQYLLKDLMSLPKRIADRRKEMLAGLRLLGQLPFEPTGIQADDLPPIQSYVNVVKRWQSDPWLTARQHGIATSSRSESSRFRPVNRKAASHSREELDEKLDKLVLRFPRTKRKYNFREAAQHWVDCFKRENIYHHWHDEEPSKRQHVWKQLDDVPARLEQRRKNHNPLNPWFVLPSLDSLGEDSQSPVTATARSFETRSLTNNVTSSLDNLASAAAQQQLQQFQLWHHHSLPVPTAAHPSVGYQQQQEFNAAHSFYASDTLSNPHIASSSRKFNHPQPY